MFFDTLFSQMKFFLNNYYFFFKNSTKDCSKNAIMRKNEQKNACDESLGSEAYVVFNGQFS